MEGGWGDRDQASVKKGVGPTRASSVLRPPQGIPNPASALRDRRSPSLIRGMVKAGPDLLLAIGRDRFGKEKQLLEKTMLRLQT